MSFKKVKESEASDGIVEADRDRFQKRDSTLRTFENRQTDMRLTVANIKSLPLSRVFVKRLKNFERYRHARVDIRVPTSNNDG